MSDRIQLDPSSAEAGIEPLLVRVEEAARILSLSRSTIYEMLDAGELPSVRRGAARRIPVAALREWVTQQTTRGAARY